MRAPAALPLLGALLAGAISGCQGASQVGRHLEQGLNPFAESEAALLRLERLGPYLVADVRSGSRVVSFYAPAADPDCAALLRPEARLRYRKHGSFGRFERDGQHCDPVGVGQLAAWRDRQPRPDTRGSAVPRATVRFVELGREAGVVLVRGRFPLAGLVGIPAGYDLVAVLPEDPACARALARGEGSLEYVPAGATAYRIVGDGRGCPVLGFARPVDDRPAPD